MQSYLRVIPVLIICALVAHPAHATQPVTPKAKKEKQAKGERFLGRIIQKTIQREGKDNPQTYPGRLLHVRRGNKTDTFAFLVDCEAGQLCSLTRASSCYFDAEWEYTAPGTAGDTIVELSCPVEYPDVHPSEEEK